MGMRNSSSRGCSYSSSVCTLNRHELKHFLDICHNSLPHPQQKLLSLMLRKSKYTNTLLQNQSYKRNLIYYYECLNCSLIQWHSILSMYIKSNQKYWDLHWSIKGQELKWIIVCFLRIKFLLLDCSKTQSSVLICCSAELQRSP